MSTPASTTDTTQGPRRSSEPVSVINANHRRCSRWPADHRKIELYDDGQIEYLILIRRQQQGK